MVVLNSNCLDIDSIEKMMMLYHCTQGMLCDNNSIVRRDRESSMRVQLRSVPKAAMATGTVARRRAVGRAGKMRSSVRRTRTATRRSVRRYACTRRRAREEIDCL